MKNFFTILIAATLSISSIAQDKNTQDLMRFSAEFQNTIQSLSSAIIQFNQKVMVSQDANEMKLASQNLRNTASDIKRKTKLLPKLESEPEFYEASMEILDRQFEKINEITELFSHYDDENWDEFVLKFMVNNQNVGAQTNELMRDLNNSIKKVAEKNNFELDLKEDQMKQTESYNLAMDRILKSQIIFIRTSTAYNEVIESVNSQKAEDIRAKAKELQVALQTEMKLVEGLKSKGEGLTSELESYLKAVDGILKSEVADIASIFDGGIESNDEVAQLNGLIEQLTKKMQTPQQNYSNAVADFMSSQTRSM